MKEITLRIDQDLFGGIKIKHQGLDFPEWDFIVINYQYPFTDNASNMALAEKIVKLLKGELLAEEYERGRQDGMKQERALNEMVAINQELGLYGK